MSENTVLGSNLNMVTPELTEQLNVNDFYQTEQPLNIMDIATEEMTPEQEQNISKLSEQIHGDVDIADVVGANHYMKMALSKGKQLVKEYKVGRNDSCPCGSGKKYKHCCLKSGVYENYITIK